MDFDFPNFIPEIMWPKSRICLLCNVSMIINRLDNYYLYPLRMLLQCSMFLSNCNLDVLEYPQDRRDASWLIWSQEGQDKVRIVAWIVHFIKLIPFSFPLLRKWMEKRSHWGPNLRYLTYKDTNVVFTLHSTC